MRGDQRETRRGAALVIAIVVILFIIGMVVFFLEQSLVYSAGAVEDRVRAEALELTEIGLAIAYQRLRGGHALDNQDDNYKVVAGRTWGRGEVSGTVEKPGADGGSYDVEVFYSALDKISERADAGSDDRTLVDSTLTAVTRPEVWFEGKRLVMLTGDLAGIDLTIVSFDKSAGVIDFDTQAFSIATGDVYEIPAGIEYQFLSDGKFQESARSVETWWWRQSRPLKKYTQRGAIVANGRVKVLGNIEIDGRDHCVNGGQGMPRPENCPSPDDHHVLDDGVKGVSTTGVTEQGGSSGIGGDGDAPVGDPDGLAYTETYPDPADIDNGADDDSDGRIDEDPYNGVDDDRDASGNIVQDGVRDEDLRFPLNPDEALGLLNGTLKGIAQRSGTYFSTQLAFQTFYEANGEILPGGKVYYLEIPLLSMGRIEMDMSGTDDPEDDAENLRPIVFIVHHVDGGGTMDGKIRNMFIIVKGLVIMDILDKVNGSTRIIGGIQTLSNDDSANMFGNGAAKIWYSSAALANLPENVSAAVWNSTTWRETH
ncbi:MAG: hypothetical protein O7H41_16615 [Planctomycetota bacterium]|nr:hypothetical protein [Planctomycetota bacterium]